MTKDAKDYGYILERIAAANHMTTTEVRREIERAIRVGMESPDPAVRAQWARMPKAGKVPTPDELIAYMVRQTAQGHADQLLQLDFAP